MTTPKKKPTALEKVAYLKDFVTDGCSMSPDLEFSECCVEHDINYSTTELSRAESDTKLRQCIEKKGYPYLSVVYWIGVRLFGWMPYYFGDAYDFRKQYDEARK